MVPDAATKLGRPPEALACTDEEWTTRDGEPAIRDGESRGNLPKDAWKKLTPAQHRSTDAKKRAGSHQSEQFVPNAEATCEARTST
jgi:hypothetical protein